MAFCKRCGAAVADYASSCAACGEPRIPTAVAAGAPSRSAAGGGFLAALFDLSFTNFITTKIIKFLYALTIALAALAALVVVISGFGIGRGVGLLTLIVVAPMTFLATDLCARAPGVHRGRIPHGRTRS